MNRPSEVPEQLSPQELSTLEGSIAAALTPMQEPGERFVTQLEEELLAEAERRQEQQQLLQTVGLVSGGIVTVTLGILGFVLLRRQRKEKECDEAPSPAPAAILAG
ncbi:MAG: hypothetical protein ACLFU8_03950 [Anaerolineales bacterium]